MHFTNPREASDAWLEAQLGRCAQVLARDDLGTRALYCEEARTATFSTVGAALTGPDRGDALHCLVGMAREWIRRASLRELLNRNIEFCGVAPTRRYLIDHFSGSEAEAFVVVFLNSQHKVIAAEEMFRGTLSQTSVYPREVVKRALRLNAGAVVLAHNHPSGSVEPSRADEFLTRTLSSALSLVDVKVLDHIVVSGTETLSFADRGLL
jgi:DNA repair protein RadC